MPRSLFAAFALVLSLAIGLVSCAARNSPMSGASSPAAVQVNALFEEYWEWVLREYPEFATSLGDHRYADRLQDVSAQAVRQRNATAAQFKARLDAVDEATLPPTLRTSVRVLRDQLERNAAINRHYGELPFGVFDPWAPITQMDGMHLDLVYLIKNSRFAQASDYGAYLKRLEAIPVSIGHLIRRMEAAMAAGWMPAQIAIRDVPRQLEAQINPDPTRSPEYAPFTEFAPDITPADRQRLAQAAQQVIRDRVIPAFRELKAFYETRYLPAASHKLGVSDLPGGAAYYQSRLEWMTTTRLDAQNIHDLGLQEVARITTQMDAVMTATGFKGTRGEFHKFITSDARFFFTQSEDMLAAYRDIAKRVDAELPRLFAVLPRQTYGIRAMRPEQGNNAESYTGGAADGSRAGYFEANVNDLSTRPNGSWRPCCCTKPCPGTTCRSQGRRSSSTCRVFAATRGSPPTAKAGRSTPKAWVTSWACTRTRIRSSAICPMKCCAPAGSSSTRACTHWAGAAIRQSTTWSSTRARRAPLSSRKSIDISCGRGRPPPTRSANSRSRSCVSGRRRRWESDSTCAASTTR